jgi:hypothetical protein
MKNKLMLYFVYLMIFTSCKPIYLQPEWQKKYNDPEVVRKMFSNPPMFYAPHAFWFWDDTIRDEKFPASMVAEMAKQHLNPGYAHPRNGLPLDQYLYSPWFNSFGTAMTTAGKEGLTLGYCDEFNWPSGQAAGRVLQQHPGLEAKYLKPQRYTVDGGTTVQYDSVDFAVAGEFMHGRIKASTLQLIGEGRDIKWTAPAGNWVVFTYIKKTHAGIDGGKVNYLDPDLMEVFIPLVHEQYAQQFGNKMGTTIPGVFVDNEGDYGWQMAWSDYLPVKYKEMKGRDMLPWLPLLTEKDQDGLYMKARCDWFDVVSQLYLESYFRPLVSWLNQHNMYYISNLWEESLMLQTQAVGDFMRITREVTVPGNDCLQMKSQEVHDFKETQSVAEFEDRPFMSELMGVAGWNQTPAQMKMSVNSIISFGVTHIVPHGINLNRRIESIPYPADWFTENPYWNYMHLWTDFSRRAAFVNRQGKLVADVLLINPLESIWALTEGCFTNEDWSATNWDNRSRETNDVYSNVMKALNSNNIDFLIADKYYLGEGSIFEEKGEPKIDINDHDFSTIVLPPMCVISRITSLKILDFAEKGGRVIILGELPAGSPDQGEKDDLIIRQMTKLRGLTNVIDLSAEPDRMESMITVLKQKTGMQLQFENADRLFTCHRKIGTSDFYWLANNSNTMQVFTAFFNEGEGAAEIWDCETGIIKPVSHTKENDLNRISLTLKPYEAYWLVFNPDRKDIKTEPAKTISEEINIPGEWEVSISRNDTVMMTSALMLATNDTILNSALTKKDYDDSLWKYASFLRSSKPGNTGTTPDAIVYWRTPVPAGATKILYDDQFRMADIWIDDQPVRIFGNEYKVPVGTSNLTFVWKDPGRDFRLETPLRFVCDQKESLPLKSWYKYGLQQFTGYIDYEKKFQFDQKAESVKLDLGDVKYMAEIWVNGVKAGESLWGPFEFDITKHLKNGDNSVKVRVGNLMVNKMWIVHDLEKLTTWGWSGTPTFLDYQAGLYGPVKLIIKN